jgi:hypothetical protein
MREPRLLKHIIGSLDSDDVDEGAEAASVRDQTGVEVAFREQMRGDVKNLRNVDNK